MQSFNKLLFFFSLIFFAHTVLAAELNLSPSSGSYNVGDTINVRVILSSSNQSANAISGTISFSKDLLSLTSISKSNSIVSIWPTEPSYSNASGTANMEGIILGGYQGTNGTILTLSFKAKAVGNADLRFITSSILANDGQGSNILSGIGQASFDISPFVEKKTAPSTPPIPEPEEEEIPVSEEMLAPVFTDYSPPLPEISVFRNIINTFSVIIPITALIIMLILLMIWGWYHILSYKEYMHKKLIKTRTLVSKSFDILGEDVKEEMKIFKKIKTLQPLTPDERVFLNQFKKDIEAAEKVILEEIKE